MAATVQTFGYSDNGITNPIHGSCRYDKKFEMYRYKFRDSIVDNSDNVEEKLGIFFPRVSEDGTVGYVVYNLIVVPDAHNRIPGQLGYHKSTRGLTQVIIFIMAFICTEKF